MILNQNSYSQSFPAKIDHFYNILTFIVEKSKPYLSHQQLLKLELASEEAIVNIINHAYKPPKESDLIKITCTNTKKRFSISIEDSGPPFNPLEDTSSPDISAPLKERTTGGYGVFLILKSIDKVHYHRNGNRNVLTFTINLH